MLTIGVLALQGDFAAHLRLLAAYPKVQVRTVRSAADLEDLQGLVLPGGESSTMLTLMHENGLFDVLSKRVHTGLACFGTCAGAILLARQVTSPVQSSFGVVDVTIERNAYGRQLASRIATGYSHLSHSECSMIFIRAPRITALGAGVKVLAECAGEPVCVQDGRHMVTTFHPELMADASFHAYFIAQILGD